MGAVILKRFALLLIRLQEQLYVCQFSATVSCLPLALTGSEEGGAQKELVHFAARVCAAVFLGLTRARLS